MDKRLVLVADVEPELRAGGQVNGRKAAEADVVAQVDGDVDGLLLYLLVGTFQLGLTLVVKGGSVNAEAYDGQSELHRRADEEARSMDVTVDEENLAIAIGRGGQNVRLASELTGWQINIMTAEEANKKQEEEDRVACEEFMNELDMSQDDAVALIHDGIYSLEELAYVPEQEIVELGIFDEATVADLRERARRVLLARALKREENLRQADASLLELEGMDHDLASRLVSEGIKTADELGDLDTEELMEKGGIAEDKARALIMAARARWTEE